MNFSAENPKSMTLVEALIAAKGELGRELTEDELSGLIAHFRTLRSIALQTELSGKEPEVKLSSSELSALLSDLSAKRSLLQKEAKEIAYSLLLLHRTKRRP